MNGKNLKTTSWNKRNSTCLVFTHRIYYYKTHAVLKSFIQQMFGVVEVLQYFWILKSLRTKNYFQFFITGCCCCFCCWGCCCCYCAQFELFVGFVQNCYIWHIPMNCWDHGWSVQGLLFSQHIEDGQCPNIRYIHLKILKKSLNNWRKSRNECCDFTKKSGISMHCKFPHKSKILQIHAK